MRTRKDLLLAGAGVLALFVVSFLFLGIFLDKAATRSVNDRLSSSFPVPAAVQKVKVRLLARKVELTGMRIANPQGFAHKDFMTLRRGEMEVRLASLWTGEIMAESIVTEGLVVRLEKIEGRQNAREVFSPGSGKEPKEEGGKRFRIRRMVLKNTLLTYPVAGGEQVATVERMEIEEPLGRERSALLREVIAQGIARSVRAGAGQAVERSLAGSLSAVPEDTGQAGRPGRPAGDGIKDIIKGSGR